MRCHFRIINIAVEGRWASISGNMLIAIRRRVIRTRVVANRSKKLLCTTLTYLRAADDALYPSKPKLHHNKPSRLAMIYCEGVYYRRKPFRRADRNKLGKSSAQSNSRLEYTNDSLRLGHWRITRCGGHRPT